MEIALNTMLPSRKDGCEATFRYIGPAKKDLRHGSILPKVYPMNSSRECERRRRQAAKL